MTERDRLIEFIKVAEGEEKSRLLAKLVTLDEEAEHGNSQIQNRR